MAIQSIERTAHILGLFSLNRTALGVTEIANELGVGKSTVHALLKTLVNVGYLERDNQSSKYRLGSKLYELGITMVEGLEINQKAAPIVQRLADETELYVRLAIPKEDAVLVILLGYSREPTISLHQIGPTLPMYATSQGKAMLSHWPTSAIKEYLDRIELKPYTHKTITDSKRLLSDLLTTKKRGYSISNEELRVGRVGFGAVVLQGEGELAGAISVSGEKDRVLGKQKNWLKDKLLTAASEISNLMGYRPRA